ncbi:MAG: DUF721 domain-containing protein [Azospirillum sp.]|nr:DUF721 domain-containing protein [Azospirillum sp.]MCA3267104.1 DUF721 domain-containing protein [Azospirillum sp.]MCZ8124579.1 DciA family protein [Magnetospirillum sp.]
MALKAIGAQVPRMTKEALKRRGAAFATLIAEWPNIVGHEIAACCLPEKLSAPPPPPKGVDAPRAAGTLALRVGAGMAMELQHLTPQLIERINAFVGYRAVERLRFVQGPLPGAAEPPAPPPPPLSEREAARLDRIVESVPDPDLRQALRRLGGDMVRGRRRKA